MELMVKIVAYGARWGLETGFLLLALWFMARIQKLQYTVPGLLISAGIACAFDLIPFVGHYIAVPVLWVSLTKVTREDFTGVAFTTGISYALVFGMNLFLLGALMGNLGLSARARTLADNHEQKALPIESEEEPDGSLATRSEGDAATNTPVTVPPGTAAQEPAQAPAQAASSPSDPLLSKEFVLRGITQNGKNSTVLVSSGAKTYTLFLNETVSVETSAGKKSIRLDKVEKNTILLDVGGQVVKVTDAPPQ